MITKRKDISTIHEVRQFIDNNFAKDIPVDLICREFALNRTKLQEGFNQLYAISVHAYISQLRMEKARTMLSETDESIKVVAIECGYKNVSSFTRIFTRVHKVAPTQYRAQLVSGGAITGESVTKIKRSEKMGVSVNEGC